MYVYIDNINCHLYHAKLLFVVCLFVTYSELQFASFMNCRLPRFFSFRAHDCMYTLATGCPPFPGSLHCVLR